MNHEDIIKLARESGYGDHMSVLHAPALERFAALVAAAEREACARIIEAYTGAWDNEGYAITAAIRARGKTK